jgi:hypothetical protein
VWHHVSTKPVEQGGRGPKELTGMVDLTPDRSGRVRARLLDLRPGRSGTVYADWLQARGDAFRARVQVATLDPFHGYKNAIDNQLDDAVAVLDAFHVVALASKALDQVRRRVQQEIHGHRDQARSQGPIMHVTCGNRGAACGNRTHDLRITRTTGGIPRTPTSTDRTSDATDSTWPPGQTPTEMPERMPTPTRRAPQPERPRVRLP